MDIHIDKKIAGLMIFAFVVGLLIGLACGHHRNFGRGQERNQMYFLQRGGNRVPFMPGGMQGGVQYFDEQGVAPMMQALPGTTTAPVPVETK